MSVHAAFLFAHVHPQEVEEWIADPYLVLLGVPDEAALLAWRNRLAGNALVGWHEPDRNDELTALAVAPSPEVERAVASLPLLLREVAMV